jgi:hypothetical protein
MQVPVWRDDEHVVWLDVQFVRNEFDRHISDVRENLVEVGGHGSQVVDNDDCHTQVSRKMAQEPGISVEAAG